MDRKVQAMVRPPTKESFKHIVRPKLFNNSPINVEDITNTHTIFEPDLEGVRGKTVIHKPERSGFFSPKYQETYMSYTNF